MEARWKDGQRTAETVQQPKPVFFRPEQEEKMAVGYKSTQPDKKSTEKLLDEIKELILEEIQTKERLRIVLEAREAELAQTQTQLRECVNELCGMCGDDQHPENGTCGKCRWNEIREE